jgi:hypothetical protein
MEVIQSLACLAFIWSHIFTAFDNMKILTIVAAILILSLSTLILRFAESRFSASEEGLPKK